MLLTVVVSGQRRRGDQTSWPCGVVDECKADMHMYPGPQPRSRASSDRAARGKLADAALSIHNVYGACRESGPGQTTAAQRKSMAVVVSAVEGAVPAAPAPSWARSWRGRTGLWGASTSSSRRV